MYTLEYTTNEEIMSLFGPKIGHSLFYDRNVDIKCRFQLRICDGKFIFDNGTGDGFCVIPTHIQESENMLTLLTRRSTYIFSTSK